MERKDVVQKRDALQRAAVRELSTDIGDVISDASKVYDYANFCMAYHEQSDLRRAHDIYMRLYQRNGDPTDADKAFMDYFIEKWYQPGIDYDPHTTSLHGGFNTETEQYEPTFEDAYMYHYMQMFNKVVEMVLRQMLEWYNTYNNSDDFNRQMAKRLEGIGDSFLDGDTEAVLTAMEFYQLARQYKE